jgi:hypothetical protein
MAGLQFADHPVFPTPDFITDAVAHRLLLKVRHVRAASKQNHVRKINRRLSHRVAIFGKQLPHRRTLAEDWQQAAFCPILHHVICLADEQCRPRLLCYDEAGQSFHHRSLSSTRGCSNEHLRRFVIARSQQRPIHPRRHGAIEAARPIRVGKVDMIFRPVEKRAIKGQLDSVPDS